LQLQQAAMQVLTTVAALISILLYSYNKMLMN